MYEEKIIPGVLILIFCFAFLIWATSSLGWIKIALMLFVPMIAFWLFMFAVFGVAKLVGMFGRRR